MVTSNLGGSFSEFCAMKQAGTVVVFTYFCLFKLKKRKEKKTKKCGPMVWCGPGGV